MSDLQAGIYDGIAAAAYHADPAPEPSMAAHDAQAIVSQSARHAWHGHPRLNPDFEPGEPTAMQEEGTALHALLLEQQHLVEAIEAEDWRSKAAQEARKVARAAGRVPLLAHRWKELLGTAVVLRVALSKHEVGDFLARPGRAEQVMVWQEEAAHGPVWCRSRVDWLALDMPVLFDLKTVGGSANPEAWARSPAGREAGLRAAHYLRGARACGLHRPRYLFVLLEREAPFGVTVCELSPALLMMGEDQHQFARDMWSACMKDGEWPSYPPMLATIEASGGAIFGHEDWKARIEQQRQRKPRPFAGVASERIAGAVRDGGEPFA